MIRKAVIPVAGLGTRLMPATKEQPKEMLPVFSNTNGQICVKPLVQIIFENIYDAGVRDFYFIIGRGKRVIEDHFTQDYEYLRMLENVGKDVASTELQRFYKKLENSRIVWVNQPSPRGFGDAVLKVHNIIGNEGFLVHAGDTHIISNEHNYLQELADEYERLDSDAILLLQEVEDPKHYGVVEV
ncbi:MAG: sugar phosphate nucleotidyltransferase, partial [Candidatus Bathyarchaeia archaeon]